MISTSPLIDKINSVIDSGRAYKNGNILSNIETDLMKFNELFDIVYKDFLKMSTNYNNLILVTNIKVDFDRMSNSLNNIRYKLNIDKSDTISLNSISSDISKINEEIILIWKNYIESRIGVIFGTLESFNELIYQMPERDLLIRKKNIINNSSPGSPRAINEIKEYINISNDLFEKIGLNEDIINFIKNMTSKNRTTTIKDMNLEVYKWLIENNFADKIKLEFKRTL